MCRKQEEKLRSRLQEEPILEVILDKKAERTSAIGFTDLLRSFAANLTRDILPTSVPLSSESHPYFLLSFLSRPHSFCFLAIRRNQTSQSFKHAVVIWIPFWLVLMETELETNHFRQNLGGMYTFFFFFW